MGNFLNFSILEQVLSQDGVISVRKGYKFSSFSLPATGKTLDIVAQHDCQPFPPSMKSSHFGVLMLLSSWIIFVIFLVYLSTCGPKMQ